MFYCSTHNFTVTDIQEAVTTVYQLTQEEKIRQQCEAREDYYHRQHDVQRCIKKQEKTIKEQDNIIRQLGETLSERDDTIRQQEELTRELRKLIEAPVLAHIELATEEYRLYGIDLWASFFKATTWEELKILAHNNNDIQEAVATVYQLTQEEKSASNARPGRITTAGRMMSSGGLRSRRRLFKSRVMPFGSWTILLGSRVILSKS